MGKCDYKLLLAKRDDSTGAIKGTHHLKILQEYQENKY
jgi:hypothetical protein